MRSVYLEPWFDGAAAPTSRRGAIPGLLLLTALVLWIAGLAVRPMQIF